MLESGFILLKEKKFDAVSFLNRLKESWGVFVKPDSMEGENGILSFDIDDFICSIGLMPTAIPNQEAEHNAAANYYCPDAVEIAKTHQAHLIVSIMSNDASGKELMTLYTKLIDTLLIDDNALGVYTSGTVFSAKFYREFCEEIRKDTLPLPIWVFIGLYSDEQGNHAYTIGMTKFGKEEMEIRESQETLQTLHQTMLSICGYLVGEDALLKDGDTLGFSDEQKWTIDRSPCVAGLAEYTLKIRL